MSRYVIERRDNGWFVSRRGRPDMVFDTLHAAEQWVIENSA